MVRQESKINTRQLRLQDSRHLAFCEYGDPEGKPVFYFHGTPGSRVEPAYSDPAGRKFGIRLIGLDRPGMGRSEFLTGRTLLDWPRDVREAAEYFGFSNYGVIGMSGGGPYALACCAANLDQINSVVLLGSWAPVAAEPLLWQQMAPLDRVFGRLSRGSSWIFTIIFSMLGAAAAYLSPQVFIRSLSSSLSAADKALLQDPELASFFAEDIQEAFRQGARGPAEDALLLYRDWGFAVEDVSAPVEIFHGTEDQFAPAAFGRYLDKKLPNSTLHLFPGKGHLYFMMQFERVFKALGKAN